MSRRIEASEPSQTWALVQFKAEQGTKKEAAFLKKTQAVLLLLFQSLAKIGQSRKNENKEQSAYQWSGMERYIFVWISKTQFGKYP